MRYTWILAVALIAGACGNEKDGSGEQPHSVYVVAPADEGGPATRRFAGVVEENNEVSLGFKTPGQISKILVREGQHVSRGQLLARLDDADYRLGVEAVEIQHAQLKDEVERARRLFEKKSMTANDFEKAEAGLRQLAVQLQVNRNKLAYTSLYAPAAGVVESVNFSAGEMVDAGTAVFTMLDMSQKTVVVDIPATIYLRRDEIESISCSSSHNPGDVCAMNLLSIVPKADGNQLYRMKLGFASGGAAMTPGMNVEVSVNFAVSGREALAIPQSALFRHDGKDCVWVVEADSTVAMRQVEINPVGAGADVEIVSGLTAADKVVRAGVRMLHEGEKVAIIGEPSATNFGGVL